LDSQPVLSVPGAFFRFLGGRRRKTGVEEAIHAAVEEKKGLDNVPRRRRRKTGVGEAIRAAVLLF
jgi:hypothetical protein